MPRVAISRKGQLVLPMSIRRPIGLELGGLVDVRLEGGRIVLQPAADARWDWVKMRGVLRGTNALQDHLAEHRQEAEPDAPAG